MSILTRVLIVFTFLLSIIFCGYNMALYNARTNHREVAENVSTERDELKRELKTEKEARSRALTQANAEITRLNNANQNIISDKAGYEQTIAQRDMVIRNLRADYNSVNEKLKQAINWANTSNQKIDEIQKLYDAERIKANAAEDQKNLLIDLAHTEEQQKNIYREEVKHLKIQLDEQQYKLQLIDNRLQAYISKYGILREGVIPEIEGKVVGVNNDVIVVNQGSDNGVQVGYVFAITRDNKFIGKANVREVYSDKCVCYIDHRFDVKGPTGLVIKALKHDNASTKK